MGFAVLFLSVVVDADVGLREKLWSEKVTSQQG
jgi:hypothetical protein